MKVIPFWRFANDILLAPQGLSLTLGQRVIAKVAFGDQEPCDLEGAEREMALEMFGGLERVSEKAKKFVCLMLGRGSGKTTMCSAYAVYVAVCQPFKTGPGAIPCVITIAPDLPTAKLSVSMCREMIRSVPAVERLVVGDDKQAITLRRPDGRLVRIEAFAAAAGGKTVRGRPILSFILDEACFFTSNADGGANFVVSDTEIFRAMKPRLMGKGMLISTPWPVETLMGTMFERNWGKCLDAVAIRASTLLVRGEDPEVAALVADEMERDPENARRELFCELDGLGTEGWFDGTALASAIKDVVITETRLAQTVTVLGPYNRLWATAAAADLGFKNDSSTLAIVQYDGHKYHLAALVEMRPRPGSPLRPSAVIAKFAEVAKQYGCTYIISDGHYRESVKEHLAEHNLSLADAPEGMGGKQESFSRVRSVLHEGLVILPKHDLIGRLVSQAKLVTAKAAAGGGLTIRIPRKVGLGHGDLVSAWVLSVHALAYGRVSVEKVVLVPNTPEYLAETTRRLHVYYAGQNERSLKLAEKEGRDNGRNRRRADGVFIPGGLRR